MPVTPAQSQFIPFPAAPSLDPPSALDMAFQTFASAMGAVDRRQQLAKKEKHELEKAAISAGIADLDPDTGQVMPISFADRTRAKAQGQFLNQAKLVTDIIKNQQEIAERTGIIDDVNVRNPGLNLGGGTGTFGFNFGQPANVGSLVPPARRRGRQTPSIADSPPLFLERLRASGLSAKSYAKHLKRNPVARQKLEEQVGGGHRADEFINQLLLLDGGI